MARTVGVNRLLLASLWLLAIAIGTALAFQFAPRAGGGTAPVFAANHCTRYEPSTSPDTLCSTNGSMFDGFGVTNGVALRDNNYNFFSASRCWELFYDAHNTYPPQPPREHDTGGCGTSGNIGHNSDGNYRYSWCLFDPPGATGRCVTFWHD
jgi:hypothetical protein